MFFFISVDNVFMNDNLKEKKIELMFKWLDFLLWNKCLKSVSELYLWIKLRMY